MSTLERAIAIAAEAHAGCSDKAGAPYILHPLRVMLSLTGLEERIVAVLHDVVEDNDDWTFDRLRREGFSENVVAGVESMTKRDGEDYMAFVQRASLNPIGRRVKRADLVDNRDLSRISNPTAGDHKRIEKYRRALDLLDSLDLES